jgi:hypothetical protein
MNYGGDIIRGIRELCEFFAARCDERRTLDALAAAASNRAQWHRGRVLFENARDKSLKNQGQSALLEAQFRFEEIWRKDFVQPQWQLGALRRRLAILGRSERNQIGTGIRSRRQ